MSIAKVTMHAMRLAIMTISETQNWQNRVMQMPGRQVAAIYRKYLNDSRYTLVDGRIQKVSKPEEYHQMTIQEYYVQNKLI